MPIFQKSVIQKYLKGLNTVWLNTAYDKFKEIFNSEKIEIIKNLKEEEYQDGFLRDLFVEVLGYTLKTDDKNFDLVREFKNQTNSKKADGAILKDEKAVAVIELKSTKTKDLTSITSQAFDYKNNQPGCKYVITSNFQKLRFYVDYSNEYEEFDLFNLQKSDFKLLYLILRKKSIFANTPQKLKDETRFHEEKISKQLYADYSNFKNKIFENLVKNNPKIEKLTLFKKTQKLLDRLLFIFFAEDCGLLPPNSISRIIDKYEKLKDLDAYKSLYDIYKQYFGFMNTGRKGKTSVDDIPAYNGGLFAPDELLDSFIIDDKILKADCLKMSAYDFNTEVDVNILGQIFEHSLNEIEEMEQKLSDNISKPKTSKRKKDGVFYTPKYITQYIVENTIGTLCTEKRKEMNIYEIEFDNSYRTKKGLNEKGKQLYKKLNAYKKWLETLKILDPACGSGAFLNQALIFLIAEHKLIDDLIADLTKQKIRLFDTDKNILEENLFGVDINEESVEIAKLSLWLRTAQKGRKLSTLNNNIKCGNSLIDDPEVAGEKAFKWNKEFKEIMGNGGFDVVIGNPPYVRNTELDRITKKELEIKYFSAHKQYDLYILFNELSLKIVKKNGLIGFIQPNKFLSAEYGINILNFINENAIFLNIYNVSLDKVFSDASVYPYIFIYKKISFNKKFDVKKITIFDICSEDTLIGFKKEIMSKKIISKINQKSISINNITDKITRGLPNNKFSFVENSSFEAIKSTFLKYSYFLPKSKLRIKYKNNKLQNIKEQEFTDNLILLPRTTLRIRAILSNRNSHILDRIYYFKTTNTDIKDKTILTFINSKLTTFYYNFYYQSTKIGGGYIDLKGSQIKNFAIFNQKYNQTPFIEKADKMLDLNKELHTKSEKFIKRIKSNLEIEKLSNKLIKFYDFDFKTFISELKKKKIQLTFKKQDEWEEYFDSYKTEINELQSQINQTDNEIDKMVYELYELTDEEINIIENSLK